MPVAKAAESEVRNLVVVLGDQLNRGAAALDGFDAARDLVWMAEVAEESTHVWSSKQRIAMVLAAMRHFAEELKFRPRSRSGLGLAAHSEPNPSRIASAAMRPER